jgi:hypothetical protein
MIIHARKEIAAPLAEEPSTAMLAAMILELRMDNRSLHEDISDFGGNSIASRRAARSRG